MHASYIGRGFDITVNTSSKSNAPGWGKDLLSNLPCTHDSPIAPPVPEGVVGKYMIGALP